MYMDKYTSVFVYVYVYVHVYMSICVYVNVCVYVYLCILCRYIHVCVHIIYMTPTYTCTYFIHIQYSDALGKYYGHQKVSLWPACPGWANKEAKARGQSAAAEPQRKAQWPRKTGRYMQK